MDDERKSATRELLRQRTGKEVPDLLREMYVDRRYSQKEIASALGINRMTVKAWLDEYGIGRDDRPPVEVPR
jgi:DNA invertase Pin-like site-specific DNA recombinase